MTNPRVLEPFDRELPRGATTLFDRSSRCRFRDRATMELSFSRPGAANRRKVVDRSRFSDESVECSGGEA